MNLEFVPIHKNGRIWYLFPISRMAEVLALFYLILIHSLSKDSSLSSVLGWLSILLFIMTFISWIWSLFPFTKMAVVLKMFCLSLKRSLSQLFNLCSCLNWFKMLSFKTTSSMCYTFLLTKTGFWGRINEVQCSIHNMFTFYISRLFSR